MPLFLALPFIALAPHTGAYPSPGPGLNDAVRMASAAQVNAVVTWNNTVEWNQAERRTAPSSAPRLTGRTAPSSASSSWDGVADCESGGNWSTSTGNGYYGGLQMTLDFWHSHGGDQFAARPDLATKAEQIAVAEQAGSRSAWPVCGSR